MPLVGIMPLAWSDLRCIEHILRCRLRWWVSGIIVISFFHGTIGCFEGISCCTSHNDGPGPFTLRLSWYRSTVQMILAFRKFFCTRSFTRGWLSTTRECSCARSRKVDGYRTRKFLYRVNSTLRAEHWWLMMFCREYIHREIDDVHRIDWR